MNFLQDRAHYCVDFAWVGKNAVFCSKVHGMKINQQLNLIEQTRLGSCIDRTEMRLMQSALLLHNPSSLKYFESTIFTGTKKKDKETTLTRKFVDAFKVLVRRCGMKCRRRCRCRWRRRQRRCLMSTAVIVDNSKRKFEMLAGKKVFNCFKNKSLFHFPMVIKSELKNIAKIFSKSFNLFLSSSGSLEVWLGFEPTTLH